MDLICYWWDVIMLHNTFICRHFHVLRLSTIILSGISTIIRHQIGEI
jgi:hypothetical protein